MTETFETISSIQEGIELVGSNNKYVPYQLKVFLKHKADMDFKQKKPVYVPTDKHGKENLNLAKKIYNKFLRKCYPDTWHLLGVKRLDKFAKGESFENSPTGYHYVNHSPTVLKDDGSTKRHPYFEAKVYNPITAATSSIGRIYYNKPYCGESMETAFYKACILVDGYFGNPEKSFSEYLSYLKKNITIKPSPEQAEEERKRSLEYRELYLHRNTGREEKTKDILSARGVKTSNEGRPAARKSLFDKLKKEDYQALPCGYPYIYSVSTNSNDPDDTIRLMASPKKGKPLSRNATPDNYKIVWSELAAEVDKKMERPIRTITEYQSMTPSFDSLRKR